MGYNQRTWRTFIYYLRESGFAKNGLPVAGKILPEEKYYQKELLELGCGVLRGISFGRPYRIAREYFESIGIKCLTIDITECNDSVKIDLRKPMMKYFHNRFDIILNAGTTEHVTTLDGQYQAFKNVHDCAKDGGIMIHFVPFLGRSGEKHGHCEFNYELEFFRTLAKLNNYKVFDINVYRKGTNKIYCKICLQKKNNDDFSKNKDEMLKYVKEVV